jgi:hypothetical protein
MKKSFAFLCSIFLYVSAYAVNGDGSSGNPFWGSITTTVQWSAGDFSGSTVYIGTSSNPDLTVGDGGHLTINPGITVIFTQLTSDLFITGTGQLTAGGTGLQVTFTKDPSVSHWGHISFQSMSGTPAASTFDNCFFEHGYSIGTNLQPLLAGGALQIDFNGVIITNCIFKNNYANFAGAIFINSSRNTTIRNSYFESNSANEAGGAVVLYSNSTALIENCVFYSNYCKGASYVSYGGGAIWSYSNTAKVTNCTFTENNSDRSGDAFYSYSSSGTKLVNCILWGSNDQYAASGIKCTVTYCAFETTKPAIATYSIVISDVADDHFNNASGGDWSLKYISPCRNAGTDSYGSPNIVPPTDYLGNSRVLTTDIGAYEVQYSYWKTAASSTDWNTASNWDGGVPTSVRDVIIPAGASNYPINPSNPGFTIGVGKQMIMNAGAKVTLGNLTNNGTLRLESDATGISSLITSGFSGNNAVIQLYLTGGEAGSPGSKMYKWHYISTPVSTLPVSTFTPVTPDIVRYYDSRVSTDMVQGWVAQDGWIYASGSTGGPTFLNLTPGLGYDFYDSNNNTFTFSGQLNTSDVPMTLVFSGGSNNGYNLLGNPFSSGLDWDYIITHGFPLNTSKSLYFTRDNALCSYIAGVGSPADVTGFIPPMQGFFTYTHTAGNTITLAAAARTQSLHARYKGTEIAPLIRLSLSDDTLSDETVVRFDEKALAGLDDDFDAVKLFYSSDNTALYSKISGIKYVINGQPYPDTFVEIPLVVNLKTAGNHAITTTQLQALPGYKVELIDNTTGFVANLRTVTGLSFSASAGSITNRFVLKVTNILTAVETPAASKNIFNIYQGFDFINIQTLADEWDGKVGSVKVFDLAGKTVSDISNAEFSKNSLIQVQSPSSVGIYLVELRSGINRYVGKVIIK